MTGPTITSFYINPVTSPPITFLITMHHLHHRHHRHHILLPIIFGLGCLSADLFDDDEVVMKSGSGNIFNSPTDGALTSPSNNAHGSGSSSPSISLDDYSDVPLFYQASENNRDGDIDSDFMASVTSPPVLPHAASKSFGALVPGMNRGKNGAKMGKNHVCCEQVTAQGQGHGCQDVENWPTGLQDQLLDILRMPLPFPEGPPGWLIPRGIWSGNE